MSKCADHATFSQNNLSISGDHNIINGNRCNVSGDHNTINGNNCSISGDHNRVNGNGCYASGDHNRIYGIGCNYSGDHNRNRSGNVSLDDICSNVCVTGDVSGSAISVGQDTSTHNFYSHSMTINGNRIVPPPGGSCSSIINGVAMVGSEVYFDSSRPGDGYWPGRASRAIADLKMEAHQKELARLRKELLSTRQTTDGKIQKLDSFGAESDRGACSICLDAQACVSFDVCNHLCLCVECEQKYTASACPVCRTQGPRRTLFTT